MSYLTHFLEHQIESESIVFLIIGDTVNPIAEHIDFNVLDVVTINGKKYGIYTYEGQIARLENAKVIISYEVNGKIFKKSTLKCR